jgi:signal transduction histidine kinase
MSSHNRAPVGAIDRELSPPELIEAAALYLINRRCREAYLHEVRGGLHALYSALELLSRSANAGPGAAAMAERATTIARRAMSNYEPLVLKTVEALTAAHETETEVDLGTLTQEVLRFLRTDITNKRLDLRADIADSVHVRACRETARLWILGLLLTCVDGTPPGQPLEVSVTREDGRARLSLASGMRRAAIADWQAVTAAPAYRADAVILVMARRWAESLGGRLELGVAGDEIRVYYPIVAPVEPEG